MRVAIQRGLLATTILVCVSLVTACGDDDRECPIGETGCLCGVGASCTSLDDECVSGVCRAVGVDASIDATVNGGAEGDSGDAGDAGCGDTTSDPNHCGGCGVVCEFGDCVDSTCQPGLSTDCFGVGLDTTTTCDDICREQGGTCVENGCGGDSGDPYTWAAYGGELTCERMSSVLGVVDRPCDVRVNETDAPLWIQCCCE
jgi:hypothetical protein